MEPESREEEVKCPRCGAPGAVPLFTGVACPYEKCKNYDKTVEPDSVEYWNWLGDLKVAEHAEQRQKDAEADMEQRARDAAP